VWIKSCCSSEKYATPTPPFEKLQKHLQLPDSMRVVEAQFPMKDFYARSMTMPEYRDDRSELRWLKGSSEEDALTRAIANGDQKALTAALTSGKVQVKKRK
jgi:hypothetical protein